MIVDDAAENDFDGIIHYLMTNYAHTTAEKATLAIKEKIASLSHFPEANPAWHKDPTSHRIVYRYVIAKKVHRIIFSVLVEDKKVAVVRIRHVKADKTRILQELEEE